MKKLQNLSKEQAEQLLKQLFRDVGVEVTWKFDDALRNIKTDERYQFIKMSMSQKKQIFSDYLQEAREEEIAKS